ncbi:aminotransferase class I/II-fold pyridoxal phosphate-dependent enzyme [Acuticoccus sp. MNP-M23]|uniref:aminotransferase class I/II-fold pyridoxal phosphate-dependent enzyme n=1 Tax=Acuticoccus sp. MNP-M23 TaxID=3072793 RepID=UPI0028156045|nr:aminotransferase class I/II-fold pyridoxal phosphate-dependent enzyme [Acuticoccus sp. MNP-M23]WMS43414.1 aminotransferase class I/II-fold pyridoxal phosphate-dependent enzyme [Acuticoccus sp. MNP-M23]
MTKRGGIGGLKAAAKDQLLAAGRASRKAGLERKFDRMVPKETERRTASTAFDFGTLDEVRQLKIQRAAADILKIESPFFRSHEVRAAAHTQIDGREYINFSSYDYCGLNGDPRVTEAAKAATDTFGTSVSASRVVSGERPFHREFEAAIAHYLGVEDAVVMVSGHATNVTTIGHLLKKDDLVLTDAFIHNSIVEGVRLSGATRLTFRHNDLDHLEELLSKSRSSFDRVLIAVEGLYSMDGDSPPLAKLVRLKNRYDAWLLVDEAHALGVVGETGRGLAERDGVDPNAVEIWMGTLSKTLSSCGGFIAGSSSLVEYLKATAPGFVFSVGLPPASTAAALAALKILDEEPERVTKLVENGQHFLKTAKAAGLDTGTSEGLAVVPIIIGDSILAAVVSHRLSEAGLNVQPIIYPAVPEKAARLRFFINSTHTFEDIERAVELTATCLKLAASEGEGLKLLANSLAR